MPDGVRLRALPAIKLTPEGVLAKEANITVNTDLPEILVTSIDDGNIGGHIDPITQQVGLATVVGYFVDPRTLAMIGEPFPIVGNPFGTFTRHEVTYNPVSKQYIVVANARSYGAAAQAVVLVALVNDSTTAGTGSPVAKAFAYDADNAQSYDDVAVAASSSNGNFILVAEYRFDEDGDTAEDTIGVLFDQQGNALTDTPGRLDLLQPLGDEDDPDVVYLESADVFFYTANTDWTGGLGNRVVGSVILTVPDQDGELQTQAEQILADGEPAGSAEGHPASFVNPFNGELMTAFDIGGNNVPAGQLSFVNIGVAPGYTFSTARPEIPYLIAGSPVALRHNHPQFAADPQHGVIAIGHNARQSDTGYPDGYVVTLLNPDGEPLPGWNPLGLPYYVADAFGASIDSGPNLHNIAYSDVSGSFLVVYTTTSPGQATYLTGFQVTSTHGGGTGDRPVLTARMLGNSIEISWPVAATGFALESIDNLSSTNWSAVSETPTPDGSNLRVTIPADGAMRLFRLSN
jgi:hypothetical protein